MNLSREGLDDLETSVVDHVETHGTHVSKVSPTAGRDDGFSYTIGMRHNFGHSEIIAFGQDGDFRTWLLNEMRERVRNGGTYEPGKRYPGIIEGYEVAIHPVPLNHVREYFGWALWFYHRFAPGEPFFGAVQVVIPDRSGVMPGENGYKSSTRQPVLDGTALGHEPDRVWLESRDVIYVCSRVSGGGPVLTVVHDHDDSWQMICDGDHGEAGMTASGESCALGHFEHVLDQDATLEAARDLAQGFELRRAAIGVPFRRVPVSGGSGA